MALGSSSVLLEYTRPGPGMPCFLQNAWELGRLLSFGRARCGSSAGGLCLEGCCLRCRVLGCVFQCWMLALMSRLLMMSVGIGSLLKLFCIVSLGVRFWHIRVSMWTPEPQGGAYKVMARPSSSCIKGCFLGLGVLANMCLMYQGWEV